MPHVCSQAAASCPAATAGSTHEQQAGCRHRPERCQGRGIFQATREFVSVVRGRDLLARSVLHLRNRSASPHSPGRRAPDRHTRVCGVVGTDLDWRTLIWSWSQAPLPDPKPLARTRAATCERPGLPSAWRLATPSLTPDNPGAACIQIFAGLKLFALGAGRSALTNRVSGERRARDRRCRPGGCR